MNATSFKTAGKAGGGAVVGTAVGVVETVRPGTSRDEIAFHPNGSYERYVSGQMGGLGETALGAGACAVVIAGATFLFNGALPLDQIPLIGSHLADGLGSAASVGAMIGAGLVATKNVIKGAALGFLGGLGDQAAERELAAMSLGGTSVDFEPMVFAVEQSLHKAASENQRTDKPATVDLGAVLEEQLRSDDETRL